MKRVLTVLMVFSALLIATIPALADATINVDAKAGVVRVNFSASDYTKYKVLVQKGTEKYVYNLFKENEEFPLQMGSGTYTIGVYENTTGKKYKKVTSVTENVTVDDFTVFKASVQNIHWTQSSKSTELAKALTKTYNSEQEKFNAVYGYVVETIAYDYAKADQLRGKSRYIPTNDTTLDQKKGICYDYSSLSASMLRSMGIPTRLAEGKSAFTEEYHAWNEVYLDGKWVVVDTTIDAQYVKSGVECDYIKANSDYAKVKNY